MDYSRFHFIKNDSTFCERASFQKMVAQKIITNPILFNNKKIDFRHYLLVYSFTPLNFQIIEGFGRVARKRFNKNDMSVA